MFCLKLFVYRRTDLVIGKCSLRYSYESLCSVSFVQIWSIRSSPFVIGVPTGLDTGLRLQFHLFWAKPSISQYIVHLTPLTICWKCSNLQYPLSSVNYPKVNIPEWFIQCPTHPSRLHLIFLHNISFLWSFWTPMNTHSEHQVLSVSFSYSLGFASVKCYVPNIQF